MITVKVNVVALIVAGCFAAMVYGVAKDALTNFEIVGMMIGTFIVIRIYDAIAGLEAFKEKKPKEKNAKSN